MFSTLGHQAQVSNKESMDLLESSSGDLKATYIKCEVTTRELAERKANNKEAGFEMPPRDGRGWWGWREAETAGRERRWPFLTKQSVEAKEDTLKQFSNDYALLQQQLRAVFVAMGKRQRVMSNCSERICTGYTSILPVKAWSYPDLLDVFLGDVQLREEYLGQYHARVTENGHFFHLGTADI